MLFGVSISLFICVVLVDGIFGSVHLGASPSRGKLRARDALSEYASIHARPGASFWTSWYMSYYG